MKKRKVITLVLLVVVLFGVSVGLIGRFFYVGYILQRPEHFTTFEPFSGKLFDIDPEEVSYIDIDNHGEPIKEYTRYEDTEDVQEITEFLNSFRYRFWWPAPDKRHSRTGASDSVVIALKNTVYNKHFNAQVPETVYCMVQSHRIQLGNAWYYYKDEKFFEKFHELK